MSNQVYANGMEVSCKAANGKVICAMPDVCFTPPQTPATPPGVPIPYPNTGMASDTTDGSKTVQVSGQEVMLKDKSCFKQSSGDEAGSAPKKGVVTSKNKGKVYFNAWSMDVKFEGENVVRNLDLTTHNHGSKPGNSPPWAYQDEAATQPIQECRKEAAKKEAACKGKDTRAEQCADKACTDAKKCLLVTYNQGSREGKNATVGCCEGETPHHLVEDHGFDGVPGTTYKHGEAPCVCAQCPQSGKNKGRYEGDHGVLHAIQGKLELAAMESAPAGMASNAWTYGQARSAGVRSLQQTFPRSKCSKACLEAQLDAYHKDEAGVKENTRLHTVTPPLTDAQKDLANALVPTPTLSAW